MSKLIAYYIRRKGKIFLYIDDKENKTHYVANRNFKLYVEKRKYVPKFCKIYSTIYETYLAAETEAKE